MFSQENLDKEPHLAFKVKQSLQLGCSTWINFNQFRSPARSTQNMRENWAAVQEDWQLSSRELDRISLLDRGREARVGFDPNLIA